MGIGRLEFGSGVTRFPGLVYLVLYCGVWLTLFTFVNCFSFQHWFGQLSLCHITKLFKMSASRKKTACFWGALNQYYGSPSFYVLCCALRPHDLAFYRSWDWCSEGFYPRYKIGSLHALSPNPHQPTHCSTQSKWKLNLTDII